MRNFLPSRPSSRATRTDTSTYSSWATDDALAQHPPYLKPLLSPAARFALLFDCDGVILETEELHRLAYNAAFREFDLTIDGEPVVWSVRREGLAYK